MRFHRIVGAVVVATWIAAALTVAMLFVYDPEPADAPPGAVGGEGLFAANCARCHGDGGTGGFAPVLAGRMEDRFPEVDDQMTVVAEGRDGMPPFAGDLTPEEMEAIVLYTRSLEPGG